MNKECKHGTYKLNGQYWECTKCYEQKSYTDWLAELLTRRQKYDKVRESKLSSLT